MDRWHAQLELARDAGIAIGTGHISAAESVALAIRASANVDSGDDPHGY